LLLSGLPPFSWFNLAVHGVVFCGLPTGISSGLNAHLNGTFELKPDRQSFWIGENISTDAVKAKWNETLFKECVSDAFLTALELMTKQNFTAAKYFSHLPVASSGC